MSYSFSSSCLWVTYTPMVLNAGSTAWLTSTPVSTPKCLLHTTTAPQFSYFTTGAITAGGQLSAPLTSVQWIAVRSIEVTIVADDPNDGGVSASQLRSRISLSNVLNGVTA